ncbi:MAG: hypothetical protein GY870_03270 [archaeon]|nr:hypothetical protein [archaeon]
MINNDDFYNEDLRVDKIIHLPSAVLCGTCSEEILDYFQDHTEEEIKSVFGDLQCFKYYEDVTGMEHFQLSDVLTELVNDGTDGYLISCSTPQMGNGSYSWGSYYHEWFYSGSYESALEKGFKWAEDLRKDGK